jgi:hypothetical protein
MIIMAMALLIKNQDQAINNPSKAWSLRGLITAANLNGYINGSAVQTFA